MSVGFLDHQRKKTVREKWNTPLLKFLYQKWDKKYFYCGLPGPEAIDIKLWRDMIRRVMAFELECEGVDNRKNIVDLNYLLTTLQIPYRVYVGPLEEVLLRGQDHDGTSLDFDELVTLYNLDFCNCITSSVTTLKGRQQLRFEALREITALQRRLFRRCGAEKFILFITVHDAFHRNPVLQRFRDRDLPKATRDFTNKNSKLVVANSEGTLFRNTEILKAFIFTCIRDYFQGQNIISVFLPPVSYIGKTNMSPMLHFMIVCKMGSEKEALAQQYQSAEEFLSLTILRATETEMKAKESQLQTGRLEIDPAAFIGRFPII